MKTVNNLQINTKVNSPSNNQFFIHKNYLLSVCNEKKRVNFYDMKTFRRKFYLKRKRHENKFNSEKWKLLYTKEHKLYLIGYEHEYENELEENKNNDKNMDIYLLKIAQRKCVKINSFKYYKIKEDEKEDKLYIYRNNQMFIYNLNINSYEIKPCEFDLDNNLYWGNLFITNNYIMFIYFTMVSRWVFSFHFQVKEKDLENNQIHSFCPYYCYDEEINYNSAINHLVQLYDNYFSVFSELFNNTRTISFAEIKIDENAEPLYSPNNKNMFFNEKEITINETGDMNIYPIDNKKCGIAFDCKNYYICNLTNMEINLKIELNINEKFYLLKYNDDNDKYQFYLNDDVNKKLLYISSY